ncbi:ribosomal-processing cysteine protease Prp [Enterococcus sp. AZ072]|uniref:ribosomal-processing cysteine protease Prp n=1 Tax=unclassified Enterococcus TaxID=2608891 RepID=UPI003D26AF7C
MITGTFRRNESGRIVSFELSGHAQSGEYGHDIVCAGVSALAISTVNGIDSLAGTQPTIDADEVEGGYLYIELAEGLTQEQTNITQILLENLLLGLQAIEQENDQYIQTKTIKQ